MNEPQLPIDISIVNDGHVSNQEIFFLVLRVFVTRRFHCGRIANHFNSFSSIRIIYRPLLDVHTYSCILSPSRYGTPLAVEGLRNVCFPPLQSVDQLVVAAGDVSTSSTTLLRIVEAISGEGKTPETAGTYVIM